MDRSAKIAPSCSLQTASSVRGDLRLPSTWRRHSRDLTSSGGTNKASSYAGLPSPDDSNASPARDSAWPSFSRRRVWWPSSLLKWVSKYPRVCFFLLYVCCTFASGFYASCTLADWVLERVRVPEAMASAKQMQESARLELTNGSKCVLETSLGQLLVLKSAVEAHRLRFQEVAKRNAKILDAFEDHAAGCSKRLFNAIAPQTPANASATSHTRAANTTRCFSRALQDQFDTSNSDHSREILDRVHVVLLPQVAAEAQSALNQRLQQTGDLVHGDISPSVKAVFTSLRRTLDATTHLGLQQLLRVSSAAKDDKENAGSQRDPTSTLSSIDLENPTSRWKVIPDQSALEALKELKGTLRKILRSIPTSDELVQQILTTAVGQEWQYLEHQVANLRNHSAVLQFELQYVVNATWNHLNHSRETLHDNVQLAESEIVASVNDLKQQWAFHTRNIMSSSLQAWQSVYDHLQSLTSAMRLRPERTRRMHYREFALGDLDLLDEEDVQTQQFYLLHRRNQLERGDSNDSNKSQPYLLTVGTVTLDVDELVGRLVGIAAAFKYLLVSSDASYGMLKILELVVALWTNSYSDLSFVDIRGISSIQSLHDTWTIFLCQHDLTSVCHFVVMQADALLQLCIEHLVWIFLGVVGTGFLVSWKWDFLRVCTNEKRQHGTLMSSSDDNELMGIPTSFQSIMRSLFPAGASAPNPVNEIQWQKSFMDEYARMETTKLENAAARAWRNQTTVLQQLQRQQNTLSALTRMHDSCAAAAEATTTAENFIDDGSCTSRFQSNASVLHPFASTEFNITTRPGGWSFDHCFAAQPSQLTNEAKTQMLERNQACATERAAYVTASSWWLLCVVWTGNRFVARMIVKACGMHWWRVLSANRLEFIGFCDENGSIQASETLSRAVQSHLDDARWLIRLRLAAVISMVACSFVIWYVVLVRML